MSSEESPHLSAYALDVLELGGLPPEEERRAREHLTQCAECTKRLAEAHTSAEHFQKVVQRRTLEKLRQRMHEQEEPRPVWARPAVRWGLAAGALVAAALGAWLALS
jgi:anti-sigma factor RsiW